MPIPNTLSRKITADFRAEKKYGGRKKICDALVTMIKSAYDIRKIPDTSEQKIYKIW